MKKLIALAVAAASVPAMAAVTISGSTEVSYSKKDAGVATTVAGSSVAAATESKQVATENTTISFAASSELDNGMTVSTSIALFSSANALSNDGGEGAVTVAGSFGSLSVGDVGGPLDSRDSQAAATAENDLSAAFGDDMSVVYTLPTFVEGLNISAGMSAKNGGDTGVASDASGIAFDYSVAGFKVYAGVEESVTDATAEAYTNTVYTGATVTSTTIGAGTDYTGFRNLNGTTVTSANTTGGLTKGQALVKYTAAKAKQDNEIVGYGVSYSISGLTVAANFAEKEVTPSAGGTTVKHEKEAYGVKYTTGALTLAYNSLEDKTDGVKKEEADTVSVSYALGGGASVYAASTSKDVSKNDESTVGIKFAF